MGGELVVRWLARLGQGPFHAQRTLLVLAGHGEPVLLGMERDVLRRTGDQQSFTNLLPGAGVPDLDLTLPVPRGGDRRQQRFALLRTEGSQDHRSRMRQDLHDLLVWIGVAPIGVINVSPAFFAAIARADDDVTAVGAEDDIVDGRPLPFGEPPAVDLAACDLPAAHGAIFTDGDGEATVLADRGVGAILVMEQAGDPREPTHEDPHSKAVVGLEALPIDRRQSLLILPESFPCFEQPQEGAAASLSVSSSHIALANDTLAICKPRSCFSFVSFVFSSFFGVSTGCLGFRGRIGGCRFHRGDFCFRSSGFRLRIGGQLVHPKHCHDE